MCARRVWLLLEGLVSRVRVELLSARQDVWDLTGHVSSSPVLLPEGALESLVGVVSRSSEVLPGGVGLSLGAPGFGAISVDVPFFLHDMRGERDLVDVVHSFWSGWNVFRPWPQPTPCRLSVRGAHPLGDCHLDLWLERPLPGWQVVPRMRDSLTVNAAVVAPHGLFRTSTVTGTGSVEVENSGDAMVFPRIRWRDAGGEVVGPSGASFVLPASDGERVVDLSPRRLRLDGALPEGVPVGGSGTWRLPDGASLEWELSVASPYG